MYINGVKETNFATSTYPSPDYQSEWSNSSAHYIGQIAASGYFDGYLADVHFVDGQALAPTDFGEFDDNNVWQPKEYAGGFDDWFDQSQTWSSLWTGTVGYGSFTNLHDADDTDYAQSLSATLTFPSAIALTSLQIRHSPNFGTATLSVNGTDVTSQLLTTGTKPLTTITGFTSLTSISVSGADYQSNVHTLYEIFVNGKKLIDSGVTGIANNSFHLDFSDNSSNAALGTDSSGNSNTWTVNNLSAPPSNTGLYASNFVSSNGFNASYPALKAFDGSTSTYAQASTTGGTLTFTPPTAISYSSSIKIYMPSAGATATINGGSAISVANSSETTIATGSGTLTSLVLAASNLPGLAYIKIDDEILVNSGLDSGTDSLVDTPTNYGDDTGAGGEVRGNYATLNPLNRNTNTTLSDGNLKYYGGGYPAGVLGTIAVSSGKWYYEITPTASPYAPPTIYFGFADTNEFSLPASGFIYLRSGVYSYAPRGGYKQINGTQTATSFGNQSINTTFGIALDLDNGTLKIYADGGLLGTIASSLSGTFAPLVYADTSSSGDTAILNFGQRAFAYAAPSGYKCLNTASLPEPTIADGSAYFDTKLYTGNGSTQTISGLGFSPDLVWLKARSEVRSHHLFDAVRGATKFLKSDGTNAETTDAATLTSFDADGFSLGSSAKINNNTQTYVGWAWDAGANSSKTYTVAVVSDSGNKYRFDGHGTSAVTLELEEGSTYTFDQSDSSNAGHPLRFSTTSNGTHGGGSEYTTGVVTNGTPGSAGAYTKITIASGAPTLHYYCTQHSGMGGQVNTNSTAGATVLSGSLNSSVYNQDQDYYSTGTQSGSWGSSYDWEGVFISSNTAALSDTESMATGGTTKFVFGTTISASTSVTIISTNQASGVFKINAGETDETSVSVSATGATETTITFNGSVKNIQIEASGNWIYVTGIKIDGKLLVKPTGTITNVPSINSVVRANPAAGFSVVSYTGQSSGSATVAHGLGAAPALILVKTRSVAFQWDVYHQSVGKDAYLILNSTAAPTTGATTVWNSTEPTSTVFSLGSAWPSVASGATIIAYCFAPVEGYSAIGSYTGNGSANGPFVFTNMRPKLILIKRTDAANGWFILDMVRDTYNALDSYLEANSSAAEGTASNIADALSNGFKVRGGSTYYGFNASNGTYIYYAVAENPFKTARAR